MMNNLSVISYVILLFFIACRQETPLEYALAASGENRKELELFLDYFREDSLKYKAACFLIENMPGAFAVNEEIVSACKPFYQMYDSLSHTYDYDSLSIYDQYSKGKDWGRQIDSLWNIYSCYNSEKLKRDMRIDIKTIKASRLITELEQAFRVWKENVYTRNCSFETFCDYILP